MMSQWRACKQKAGSALLLFRLGDFYEAFEEDALLLSQELDVTLTKRQEIPMAGIPAHASDGYIDRLVAKGYRVAIAEQIEDPREVKGLVKREIVRTVSPGTIIHSSLLEEKAHNFMACIVQIGQIQGLALLDLTTGAFKVSEFDTLFSLADELHRVLPKELLVSKKWMRLHANWILDIQKQIALLVEVQEDFHFEHEYAYKVLSSHFQVHSLDGFGLTEKPAATSAAGALLQYVHNHLHLPTSQIKKVCIEQMSDYMQLDRSTQRHLELISTDKKKQTLLSVIDETKTAMGGRELRYFLTHPLLCTQEILKRQDAVEELQQHLPLREVLKGIQDLERLVMRIETGSASPRDLGALRLSLEAIAPLKEQLKSSLSSLLCTIAQDLHDVSIPLELLKTALNDELPLRLSDGNLFRAGFHAELDALKSIQTDSQSWVASYQTKLRETTGIKTLKVGFTKAFGYYIEVSRGQAERTPDFFERKQTLVNAERFITEELKLFEYKILHAEEKIASLELELFTELKKNISAFSSTLRVIAKAVGTLDALSSLSFVAKTRGYVRPQVDQSDVIAIKEGRHPVVETVLTDPYIPNDLYLDGDKERLHLITGPNMAGKSTFIRQAALIVILAQMGSFVPAKSARIGIVDKVFTRIGASDDLSRGQSTFMVEMTETAHILHHATSSSLVILDEIGRGTSTYDGISIAWAVAEYLLTEKGKQAKTLFATHYWELTALDPMIPGASNYHVSVYEGNDGIVFLRKIVKGSTDKSYGIHVAKLAGLPVSVLHKAKKRLDSLEKGTMHKPKEVQLSLLSHPLVEEFAKLDPNALSPMQALQLLFEWKKKY